MKNNSTFIAVLTTRGRISGKKHSKMLKAVKYKDKIYFSRHRPDSDWFKNVMQNRQVTVEINGKKTDGIAVPVHDEKLSQKISELKYPDQSRAKEKRVVIKVTLYEQL